MFMAILNDTYSEVKEDVENRKEDFQVRYDLLLLNVGIYIICFIFVRILFKIIIIGYSE